jgi:hypothetical protein
MFQDVAACVNSGYCHQQLEWFDEYYTVGNAEAHCLIAKSSLQIV